MLRHVVSRLRGFQHAHGYEETGDGWSNDINAAAAEMAVARLAGRYWDGNVAMTTERERRRPDILPDIEVKSTDKETNRLIVHRRTDDRLVCVLAIGKIPTFRVVGWIRAKDAKREDWWEDPSGKNRWAFFVAHADLNPLPLP